MLNPKSLIVPLTHISLWKCCEMCKKKHKSIFAEMSPQAYFPNEPELTKLKLKVEIWL